MICLHVHAFDRITDLHQPFKSGHFGSLGQPPSNQDTGSVTRVAALETS